MEWALSQPEQDLVNASSLVLQIHWVESIVRIERSGGWCNTAVLNRRHDIAGGWQNACRDLGIWTRTYLALTEKPQVIAEKRSENLD